MHTTDREADRAVLRFLAYAGMTVCRALHDTAVMALVIPPQHIPARAQASQPPLTEQRGLS